MLDEKKIELLEKALIEYVRRYGFIKEARDYYIGIGVSDTSQKEHMI